MATEAVLKYLKETNRPYSANDITQNLHNEWGKTAVQKALDELVGSKEIREKIYGKQKVYCVIQDAGGIVDEEDVQSLDQQIKDRQAVVQAVDEEYRKLDAVLKQLLSQPTTEDAEQDNDRLEKLNGELEAKLNELTASGAKIVSKEEWDKVIEKREKTLKMYKNRKRMCNEMLDTVYENGSYKSKKHLIEEIGLETEESINL